VPLSVIYRAVRRPKGLKLPLAAPSDASSTRRIRPSNEFHGYRSKPEFKVFILFLCSSLGGIMANILIVEDERAMQDIIVEYMRKGGHICFTADDGVDALMLLKSQPMDLMVLDLMMPHLDGFSVCKLAREMSNMPIIMLTAKSAEDDKLRGYEYGADDYMTKPFSPKVLLAKVNALLRRTSPVPSDAVYAGKITLLPKSHTVYLDGQEISLTHTEYELLYFFMSNPSQIFTRDQLLNRIWGYDFEGTTRTVDVHIKNLRQKLGDEGRHIVTLIRSGYKFEVMV